MRGPVSDSPASLSQSLLDSALSGGSTAEITDLARQRGAGPNGNDTFSTIVNAAAAPFGAMHHETQCGFKIRGSRFTSSFALGAAVEEPGQPTDDLRAQPINRPFASVLLTLENGAGIVLPAVSGFLCAVTVDQGELVDVAYEPSDNTDRWAYFEQHAAEVRTLRAVAASATRNGVFRLEGDDALKLAQRMQYEKSIDPALAIYAAYAYQDLQRKDLILEMSGFMRQDLGARFFDLALLAGELRDTTLGTDPAVMGFMPLLAQGWAQLSAYRVRFPEPLNGIERTLMDSPWTLFNREGVAMLRNAIQLGVVI
jgi:hypothetical protein